MCVLFLEIEVYADTKHLVGAGELVGVVGCPDFVIASPKNPHQRV